MIMAAQEDQMQVPSGGEERILVSVRLRPLNEKETAKNEISDWEGIDNTTIIYRSPLSISERSMYPSAYTFDRVFSADCSTRQVYEEGAKEVALSVVSGVNASVFAYGQTSSGKTYTMTGITDYTVADIYDYIEKHKEREFLMKFSAMEIYNESVRDLLSADSTPLRLLDDPEKGTVVEKLTEETLRDWNHFKELLSVCDAQRQIGETALNEVSSRSHQILRLTIESTAREFLANDKLSALTATVNFVDLAGSERASQSLSAGTRLKEGCHINRSLLTLGTVIRKLSKGKNGHIPFRDSKLTRILQSSLGGNARTAIICTMSPARVHVEQSRNTLLFASCAKEVTTNAQVNVVMSDKDLVKHLQRELARLESELKGSARTIVTSDTAELLREKNLEIEKLNKEVLELTEQLDLARSQIEDLQQKVEEGMLSKGLVSVQHQYPKLRVKNAWDSQNSTPESPLLAYQSFQDTSVESSNMSPRSTCHSRVSSDENLFQLPLLRVDFLQNSTPQPLSVANHEEGIRKQTHLLVEEESEEQSHVHEEEIGEQSQVHEEEIDEHRDESSDDLCKEVRCIEMENSSNNRYPNSNISECYPSRYAALSATPLHRVDNLEHSEVNNKEDKVKEVSGFSPTKEEEKRLSKTPPHCGILSPRKSFQQLLYKDMSTHRRNIIHPDFISPSPEDPSPSPWFLGKETLTHQGMRLIRSRSCRASLMSNSSFSWFEKDERIYLFEKTGTPTNWSEKEFIGIHENIQATPTALQYGVNNERLSPNDLSRGTPINWCEKDFTGKPKIVESVPSDASVSELETKSIQASNIGEAKDFRTVDEGAKDSMSGQNNKQLIHHAVEVMEKQSMLSPKSFRDVALDPIQDYLATPSAWPLEFERLQTEIIELWHACNVSLGHRTYFFLLFSGDQKDHIYLQVEHRRLTFIKESFTRSNKTEEDGRTLTPTSSMRALNRERYKLSQHMQKRLSKEERDSLFLRWGIGLNTKNRRIQLAHRLWSETKDMEHIIESASVVGKLLGFIDMDLASKEMFGLNFSLTQRAKKSSRWKRSALGLSVL